MSALAWDASAALEAHARFPRGRVYGGDDEMTADERAGELQRKRMLAWNARKRAEAASLGLTTAEYLRMGAEARKALMR